MALQIQHFFDPVTSTLTYVASDPQTLDAVVIDPVWDYDAASGELSTRSVTPVLDYLRGKQLKPHFVLETHAHADHLSSSQLFKDHFPNIQVGAGARIVEVQKVFKNIFNLPEADTEGALFDRLFQDGEKVKAGSLEFEVLFTPGHTPACVCYRFEDVLFSGDALFMPDCGTGRCDFPSGSAEELYKSVQRIYSLPDSTRIFVGHDYQPQGRPLAFTTTVAEQKEKNAHLKAHTAAEEFISFRTRRDATLSAPKLLVPSLQVNIRAGRLPLEFGKN